jgi:hypothetical protein
MSDTNTISINSLLNDPEFLSHIPNLKKIGLFCFVCFVLVHIIVKIEFTSKLMKKSLVSCPYTPFLREITYDIKGNHGREKNKKGTRLCFINGWIISHILFFGIMGFLFPDYALLLVLIGFTWEITEFLFGWHNWLDIFWNIIGIVIGVTIAKISK